MENYKLKHLLKYCCKPANELEFEAVKMAAEIVKFPFYDGNFFGSEFTHFAISSNIHSITMQMGVVGDREEITVLDFCKKLRMTEEEARELEDDRVDISLNSSALCDFMREGVKQIVADTGYKWRLSDDCKEVCLVRAE